MAEFVHAQIEPNNIPVVPPNSRVKLPSRRMVARRPSRLALRFRTAARHLQAVMNIGQAARRAGSRRVKPARSLREGR